MGGYLPASEEELFRSTPKSNQRGVFPRSGLAGDEKLLFETRPNVMGLHPGLSWGGLVVFAFFLLLWSATLTSGNIGEIVGFLLLALLVGIPFFYPFYARTVTAYALTDQRVVLQSGSDYESAALTEVQSVTNSKGSAKIVFQLAPPTGGRREILGHRPRHIVWRATPAAPSVAAFAQRAVALYRARRAIHQARENLVVSSLEGKLVCAYCGTVIDLTRVDPADPKCPTCSAPLAIPPLGADSPLIGQGT